MTKIPSVQERVDEFTSKIQKSSKDGGFLNQNDLFPNRFLIAAWLKQTLTADRTALLTELRDSELLEEKFPDDGNGDEDSINYGHNTLARAIKAYLDELIKSNSNSI